MGEEIVVINTPVWKEVKSGEKPDKGYSVFRALFNAILQTPEQTYHVVKGKNYQFPIRHSLDYDYPNLSYFAPIGTADDN